MKQRHKRLAIIVVGVVAIVLAGLFVLNAFRSNIVFFFSPSEIYEGKAPIDGVFRVGGMVQAGSVKKSADGLTVDFIVTDYAKSIPVRYVGILPDLFREGQGVVAQGTIDSSYQFQAGKVLAKHDEKYMPPEAAAAMKGGSYTSDEQ